MTCSTRFPLKAFHSFRNLSLILFTESLLGLISSFHPVLVEDWYCLMLKTAGVNWHMAPNVRLMANYGFIDIVDTTGKAHIFQMRAQVDF